MTNERDPQGRHEGLREVLAMAGPVVLGNVSFLVMGFVDVWFVSKIGRNELAAVGSAGIWSYTLSTIILGVVACVSTFAAQSLGRERRADCSRYAWQGIYLSFAAGAVALIMWPLSDGLFALMEHTPEVHAAETLYFRIRLLGYVFVAWQAAQAAFFQAIGRPIIPMYVAFAVNIINVVLDYALIFGHFGFPRMEIAGAAWATVISTAIQVILLQAVFTSKSIDKEYSSRRTYRIDLGKCRDLFRIGWPAGVTMFLDVASWSVFTSYLVGRLGTTQLAAQTAALQYMHLIFVPALGLNFAITAIVGKWIGQGRADLAKARTYTTMKVAALYMITIGSILAIFGSQAMRVFSADAAVIELGHSLLIMAALFAGFDAVNIVVTGALRGAGDTRWMMVATFVGSYFFCLPLAYLLSGWAGWGARGAWVGATLYIIGLSGVMYLRFRSEKWRDIQIFSEGVEADERAQEDSDGGEVKPSTT